MNVNESDVRIVLVWFNPEMFESFFQQLNKLPGTSKM